MRLRDYIKIQGYNLDELPVSKPTIFNWIYDKTVFAPQRAKVLKMVAFLGVSEIEFNKMLREDIKYYKNFKS